MKNLKTITYIFIILGALNWGLIGFFSFDIVSFMFGEMTALTRLIYALVGLSGIMHLVIKTSCKRMEKGMAH